jgi:hypothetical protein
MNSNTLKKLASKAVMKPTRTASPLRKSMDPATG